VSDCLSRSTIQAKTLSNFFAKTVVGTIQMVLRNKKLGKTLIKMHRFTTVERINSRAAIHPCNAKIALSMVMHPLANKQWNPEKAK
jgi:hypothetical protein